MHNPTPLHHTFHQRDFDILHRETAFQGYFRIDKLSFRYRLFAGGYSPTIEREIFERGDAAGVLLLDPHLEKIILIEQIRPGAFRDEVSPWLFEIVAGIIEPDETPEAVITREAVEEARCHVLDIIPIYEYWVSPGGSSERLHLFCGKIDANNIAKFGGLDHENEDIRIHSVAVADAFTALERGIFNNASIIIAMQWLRLHYEQLRIHWL